MWCRPVRPARLVASTGHNRYLVRAVLREFATLLPYMKRYRLRYAVGVLFLVVTNVGQIAIPQMLKIVVDVISSGSLSSRAIVIPLLEMVRLALAVAVGRFGWRTAIFGASRRIENELRQDLYAHLLTLSSRYFSRVKTGDLMARSTNDMMNIRTASGIALVSALDGIFMTIAILIIMFGQNPRIAALTITPTPVVTVLVLGVGRILGVRFQRVQEGFSRLSEHIQEALSGVRVLKSFVREKYSLGLFERINDEYRDRNMALVRVWGLFFPLVTFLSGLTTLLLLWVGGVAVIDGTMSPGTFVAFLSYLEMLIWPMLGAGFTINVLQRGAASLGRINEVLNEKPDIVSPPSPVRVVPEATVKIAGLTYSYEGAEAPVLDEVSIDVPEGSTIGILGRTGSGKSTLLKLIPRILDPPAGTVFVGGIDVRDYELGVLRGYVGMVPQDTFLFSATVSENIAFARPGAGEEEIRAAAELSTIDRDLAGFPHGYETEVGERGVTLSGGQKQRIAISRAILANPRLLIFDDALSAVDAETEELILRRFLDLRSGRTNIIVSNRVSTLAGCDRVYVLEAGRVSASGTHRELVSAPGLYRQIHRLQSLQHETKR